MQQAIEAAGFSKPTPIQAKTLPLILEGHDVIALAPTGSAHWAAACPTHRRRAPGKAELQRLRAAARATAIEDKRVNIRLSSVDLLGIQAKALEEGMPYQTLIASVLHKYVTGKLSESRPSEVGDKRLSTPRTN